MHTALEFLEEDSPSKMLDKFCEQEAALLKLMKVERADSEVADDPGADGRGSSGGRDTAASDDTDAGNRAAPHIDVSSGTPSIGGHYPQTLHFLFCDTEIVEGLSLLPRDYRKLLYRMTFRLVAQALLLEQNIKVRACKRFKMTLKKDLESQLSESDKAEMRTTPGVPCSLSDLNATKWRRYNFLRGEAFLMTNEVKEDGKILRKGDVTTRSKPFAWSI